MKAKRKPWPACRITAKALGTIQNDDQANWMPAWLLSPSDVIYAWASCRNLLETASALMAAGLLLWPGILDDNNPVERELGIAAGLAWGRAAEVTVVYEDHGVSEGMRQGIIWAEIEGRPVERREILK